MSGCAMLCCGCAEWSPAMSTGGSDVRQRVRAVCVAGVAGAGDLRARHVEGHHAQVVGRVRGQQICVTTVRGCGCDTVYIKNSVVLPFTRMTYTHTQRVTVSRGVAAGRRASQGGSLEVSRTPVIGRKVAATSHS